MQPWQHIDARPDTLSQFLQRIGHDDLTIKELFSLEPPVCPVLGLIFQLDHQPKPSLRQPLSYYHKDLFFSRKVIRNAGAAQALLHLLLNLQHIHLTSDLLQLQALSREMDSDMKGLAVSNSEWLRDVNNELSDEQLQDSHLYSQLPQHFISYVPFKDKVYELDSSASGPVVLGTCNDHHTQWIQMAMPHIKNRIKDFQQNDHPFSLLALVQDQHHMLAKQVDIQVGVIWNLIQQARISGQSTLEQQMVAYVKQQQSDDIQHDYQECQDTPQDIDIKALPISYRNSQKSITTLRTQMDQLYQQEAAQHKEEQRLGHNYIPFLMEVLRVATQQGLIRDQPIKKPKV